MKNNKILSKSIAICLTVFMLLGAVVPSAALAGGSDYEGHWAQEVIDTWLDAGLINGYPDGTFRPNQTVTRAEFMTMVNNAFGFESKAGAAFTDVSEGTWYYPAIQTAVKGGYVGGYPDGSMKPNASISRQEAAVIIANVLSLVPNESNVSSFTDASSVPAWSKGAIGIVTGQGVMSGYPDGRFGPSGNITRAEAVTALNSAKAHSRTFVETGEYKAEDGEYVILSNVVVRTGGVTLEDFRIKGDLVIAEEVGDGTVILNNLTVEGDTYIRGGGTNSIRINGGSFRSIIVESAPGGGVRVLTENMDSEVEIVVSESMEGKKLLLEGNFDNVVVRGSSLEIETLGETRIKQLSVDSSSRNLNVTLSASSVISKASVESDSVSIGGSGKVESLDGSGADKVTVDESVTKPDDPEEPSQPSGGGSGGGGGSTPPATEEPGDEEPGDVIPRLEELIFREALI